MTTTPDTPDETIRRALYLRLGGRGIPPQKIDQAVDQVRADLFTAGLLVAAPTEEQIEAESWERFPSPDREKLIADAKKRAKRRRGAGWLEEADMLDRLIAALAAQPVLDPEKVADHMEDYYDRWSGPGEESPTFRDYAESFCEAAKRGGLT